MDFAEGAQIQLTNRVHISDRGFFLEPNTRGRVLFAPWSGQRRVKFVDAEVEMAHGELKTVTLSYIISLEDMTEMHAVPA